MRRVSKVLMFFAKALTRLARSLFYCFFAKKKKAHVSAQRDKTSGPAKPTTPFLHVWAALPMWYRRKWISKSERNMPQTGDRLLAVNGVRTELGVYDASTGTYDHANTYRKLQLAGTATRGRIEKVEDARRDRNGQLELLVKWGGMDEAGRPWPNEWIPESWAKPDQRRDGLKLEKAKTGNAPPGVVRSVASDEQQQTNEPTDADVKATSEYALTQWVVHMSGIDLPITSTQTDSTTTTAC